MQPLALKIPAQDDNLKLFPLVSCLLYLNTRGTPAGMSALFRAQSKLSFRVCFYAFLIHQLFAQLLMLLYRKRVLQ